jgi:hypothetical protein
MKVTVAVKKSQLSTLTTVYHIFSPIVHSLLFFKYYFLIIFFNFCFHFSLTLRSPSHSLVSPNPNPNPLHYNEEEAPITLE